MLNTAFWVIQGLAGVMFILAGGMKITQPVEKLATRMGWVNDYSVTQVRLIGLSELLGGLGLILPGVTHILPILTPVAAACLTVIMAGAVYTHFRRKETNTLAAPVALLVMVIVIAIGRFWIQPF